jgi:hypothetical protein
MHRGRRRGAARGGQAIAIFRIFQEMLSNVARHSPRPPRAPAHRVDGPPDPVLYLTCATTAWARPPQALGDARAATA